MKKPIPYDPRSLHLIYSSLLLLQLVVTSVVLYTAQENAVITFDIQRLTNTAAPVVAGINACIHPMFSDHNLEIAGVEQDGGLEICSGQLGHQGMQANVMWEGTV